VWLKSLGQMFSSVSAAAGTRKVGNGSSARNGYQQGECYTQPRLDIKNAQRAGRERQRQVVMAEGTYVRLQRV